MLEISQVLKCTRDTDLSAFLRDELENVINLSTFNAAMLTRSVHNLTRNNLACRNLTCLANCQASTLDDGSSDGHGLSAACGKPHDLAKKEKRTKKERKQRPVETVAHVEIRTERGFPHELGKVEQTTLDFSTVTTGPAAVKKQTIQKTGTRRGSVETAATVEIRTRRGFPQWLGKASHTTRGFSTVPTDPTIKTKDQQSQGSGSTLASAVCCPNIGVHPRFRQLNR